MLTSQLLNEALVVAIVTAVIGSMVSVDIMYANDRDFTFSEYKPIFLAFFITGIVCHLGFEFAGANKWYCTKGNACRPLSAVALRG